MSVLKKMIKEKKKLLIRFPLEEFEKIKAKADKFTNGNLTQWIIHAAENYSPSREELEVERYISGECCVNCKKNQSECRCSDQEIEQATKKLE